MSTRRRRIVIVGAGITGSLVAAGLAGRKDVEVICLERVASADCAEAGTGLNIGPNAIKALKAHLPESAAAILSNSYRWRSWRNSVTDGTVLSDLRLESVADEFGIRIRWSRLYALLREPIDAHIRFGCEVTGCGMRREKAFVTYTEKRSGEEILLQDIDLLIAGDGRYSVIREHVLGGRDTPYFLGVCLYRVLFPVGDDCPIDDYEQWFSGPNRLLAYRIPENFVYLAGSFPIDASNGIPPEMKRREVLAKIYLPPTGKPSGKAAFLIAKLLEHFDSIHWARLQEGKIAYGDKPGILLLGDSAHPMVPTLGQGATQACEDACVAVDEIVKALDESRPLSSAGAEVAARRMERIQFVVDFSRDATDTMLAGADSVAGTLEKAKPPFLERLSRLYRDTPEVTRDIGRQS